MDDYEHKVYLRNIRRNKILVCISQLLIISIFLFLWEYLSNKGIINSFIYSSPRRAFNSIIKLYLNGELFQHIWVTVYETFISFILATFLGVVVAVILWYNNFLYRVLEPYLTIINSLPKVAMGPVIIIMFGANVKSVIIMALLISLIVTICNVYNGFANTDKFKIRLLKSFKANKLQILKYLIIPYNYHIIINSLKINVSMSLIGVIMGEFLVSKQGLGYLINYGSQVFNLDLVFGGIILLLVVSYLMYIGVVQIERMLSNKN